MEIFNLDKTMKLPILELNCTTIGNFDGVHIGHQNLIKETKEAGFKSLVITFDEINKDNLFTLEDKIEKIKQLEVDYLIILKYEDFKNMFYTEFIKMLKKLKTKKVVIGKDFRFGFKQEGDYIDLENKFEVKRLDDILIDNKRISSTSIRQYLTEGSLEKVNELLGYNYFVKGIVVKGNQLGRTIGFPTANLETIVHLIKPGVYKTITFYDDKEYKSITNIGVNPTFNKVDTLKIETFLLNENIDLYDKEIKVEFITKLRDEKKFNNKEELIEVLNNDTKSWL
ncbi:MAG: bifunctional riboflavin kinase/FAD synthetase [bacterium]